MILLQAKVYSKYFIQYEVVEEYVKVTNSLHRQIIGLMRIQKSTNRSALSTSRQFFCTSHS